MARGRRLRIPGTKGDSGPGYLPILTSSFQLFGSENNAVQGSVQGVPPAGYEWEITSFYFPLSIPIILSAKPAVTPPRIVVTCTLLIGSREIFVQQLEPEGFDVNIGATWIYNMIFESLPPTPIKLSGGQQLFVRLRCGLLSEMTMAEPKIIFFNTNQFRVNKPKGGLELVDYQGNINYTYRGI